MSSTVELMGGPHDGETLQHPHTRIEPSETITRTTKYGVAVYRHDPAACEGRKHRFTYQPDTTP